MRIKYFKNIQASFDGMQKIAALAFSANSKKFAVASADRIIHLYDETAQLRDKFSTKPAQKGQKSYIVRSMAFSPDSLRLAIAQSDKIVFIYKLGADWGQKKSICNKFPQDSSVTCLCWPNDRQNQVVIGLAQGKVRIGMLKNNKSSNIFNTNSYVVSLASNPDGNSIVSGHLDGSIMRYDLNTGAQLKIGTHTSVPYSLSWGVHILAAGNDNKVYFYESEGGVYQRFEYASDPKVKEFTCAHFNSNGDTVAVGNYNRFYIYSFNIERGQWEEVVCKQIQNYYSVTALAWKGDGSRLAIGSLCGSVDLFDVYIKRTKYKGFEFIYLSISQVIVLRVDTRSRIVLKSNYGCKINKINIYQDRYLVAQTNQTLLLGDMQSCKLSELLWRGSGKEKYDFSNPNVCMVFNAGELSIVEYGINSIIGTCRTEHVHPHLISARLNYTPAISQDQQEELKGEDVPNRIIAYLIDPQTACIQDITNSVYQATINHDSKIDFLELNPSGNRLLFKDKRKQLHIFNVKEQKKVTLLNFCTYVNWVPDSDVVVAQNRSNLCVWYSIDEADKVTMYNIKGDVQEIERTDTKTDVIVYDGINTYSYLLDSPLIEFGSALERRDLERAVQILDPQELTPEVQANWKALANLALTQQRLLVAERCFAALGDICKSRYLRNLNKIVATDGANNFRVQAKLAMLNKEFFKAQEILINQNQVEEAMDMYQQVHRWDESLKLAKRVGVPDVDSLQDNYFQWLLESGQEAKGAQVKARKGDYSHAVTLYLKAGFPAKAAQLIMTTNFSYTQDQMQKVANALTGNKMYEKAGQFFERMDFPQRALDSYVRGNAYRKAIDLARHHFPQHVVPLEEKYGDYLVQQKDVQAAVEHYVQANCITKAIEAAIEARHWDKAVKLVTSQPTQVARPYYSKVARHYADVRQTDLAQKYFVKAGEPVEAFDMYIRAHKWDQAYSVISNHYSQNDVATMYIKHAKVTEGEGRLKDAERMYLTVNQPDLAINMYKKAKQYDHMIRLVVKYRRDLLKDTHEHLAKTLEMQGNLKQAQHHYIESGQWASALKMYRAHQMWDDAYRVVRSNGSNKQVTQFALKWANQQGSENGTKLLIKLGMIQAAVEFKTMKEQFDEAFRLANAHAKYKLQDVHVKYALNLQDNRRFKQAEEHYIKGNKPTQAIQMYEHQSDWHSALQVARQYHPDSVPQVAMNQGKHYLDRKDYQKAESCFINARQPDVAIRMYLEAMMYNDAHRVASKHAPHLADEIYQRYIMGNQWDSKDWGRGEAKL